MSNSLFKDKGTLIAPLVLLAVYTALPNRYAMNDAIYFAQAAEAGNLKSPLLWHPSHLLYEPLVYCLYHALRILGFNPNIFQLCTTLGILSAFFLAWVASQLLVLNQAPSPVAALAMMMWGGCYVVWHCTTQSDLARNLLALLVLMGAFYVVAQKPGGSSRAWPFLSGLLIGLAGLFHILTVFAVPSLCFFIWRSVGKSERVRVLVTILLVSAATVLLGYGFAILFLGHVQNLSDFMAWFAAPGGAEWWQFDVLRGMLDFVLTAIRAVFGTVAHAPLRKAVFSFGSENTLILLLALLSATILVCWGCLIFSDARRRVKTRSALGHSMLIWLVSYLPFALLFDPRDIRVFLYLSLPSALLVAARASRGSLRLNQIATGITTVLLFGVNGSTIMERENRPETQRAYQLLQSMNALSQDLGDLFLVGTGTDAAYGLYFGNRKTMPLKPGVTDLSVLRSRLTQTRLTGKCVFVENELLLSVLAGKHPDSSVLKEWLNLTPASLSADSDPYGFSALAGCPSPRGIPDVP